MGLPGQEPADEASLLADYPRDGWPGKSVPGGSLEPRDPYLGIGLLLGFVCRFDRSATGTLRFTLLASASLFSCQV